MMTLSRRWLMAAVAATTVLGRAPGTPLAQQA